MEHGGLSRGKTEIDYYSTVTLLLLVIISYHQLQFLSFYFKMHLVSSLSIVYTALKSQWNLIVAINLGTSSAKCSLGNNINNDDSGQWLYVLGVLKILGNESTPNAVFINSIDSNFIFGRQPHWLCALSAMYCDYVL